MFHHPILISIFEPNFKKSKSLLVIPAILRLFAACLMVFAQDPTVIGHKVLVAVVALIKAPNPVGILKVKTVE